MQSPETKAVISAQHLTKITRFQHQTEFSTVLLRQTNEDREQKDIRLLESMQRRGELQRWGKAYRAKHVRGS